MEACDVKKLIPNPSEIPRDKENANELLVLNDVAYTPYNASTPKYTKSELLRIKKPSTHTTVQMMIKNTVLFWIKNSSASFIRGAVFTR